MLQPCLPASLSSSASVPPKRTVMNKEALLRDLRPARARKSTGADADGEEGTDHDMDEVLS